MEDSNAAILPHYSRKAGSGNYLQLQSNPAVKYGRDTMAKRNRTDVLILVSLAICVAISISEIVGRILPAAANERGNVNSQSVSRLGSAPKATADGTMPRSPSAAPWDVLRRPTASRAPRAASPAFVPVSAWQDVLAQADPKARDLFETGMNYLDNGSNVESRMAFQTLVRTYSGDKAEPLAYWATALTYYRGGGEENLLLALDQLTNYLDFYPHEAGLEDFVEAARADIMVIWNELRNSASNEEVKMKAAKVTSKAMTQFLRSYPDSPAVYEVRRQLAEIKQYLPVGAQQNMAILNILMRNLSQKEK